MLDRLLAGRHNRDEKAWELWECLVNNSSDWLGSGSDPMLGYVLRMTQQARSGTKAVVEFGPRIGRQDTWWPKTRPPVGRWVTVEASLWVPPGTHSKKNVYWVNNLVQSYPKFLRIRASRHGRRIKRSRNN